MCDPLKLVSGLISTLILLLIIYYCYSNWEEVFPKLEVVVTYVKKIFKDGIRE